MTSVTSSRPIRVYLLDDLEVVRGGLRALLGAAGDVEVVGESGSAVGAGLAHRAGACPAGLRRPGA